MSISVLQSLSSYVRSTTTDVTIFCLLSQKRSLAHNSERGTGILRNLLLQVASIRMCSPRYEYRRVPWGERQPFSYFTVSYIVWAFILGFEESYIALVLIPEHFPHISRRVCHSLQFGWIVSFYYQFLRSTSQSIPLSLIRFSVRDQESPIP